MPTKAETITLFGGFTERRRYLKSGAKRSKYTIEVKSEPLLHHFDDRVLGAGPALAIQKVYSDAIKAIPDTVKKSTQERRYRHARNQGTESFRKRYKGPRTKEGKLRKGSVDSSPRPPHVQWGNDSRRLANGLFVRENKTDQSWTVNVPANRFNPELFGAGLEGFLLKLHDKVPVLGNPYLLINSRPVLKAIDDSIDLLIEKAKDERHAKLLELKAARRAALADIVQLGRHITGM